MFDDIQQKVDDTRPDGIFQVQMAIKNIDNNDQSTSILLNPSYLGPLSWSDSEVKAWLRTVWYFELGFSFTANMPENF